MSSERPVNLSFATVIRQPFTAIASITHRITGIILFGAVGLLLYWLDMALESETGFAAVAASGGFKVLAWLVCVAVAYHFFAGLKHLLLDFHIGDSLQGGRTAAAISVLLTLVSAALAGAWIW